MRGGLTEETRKKGIENLIGHAPEISEGAVAVDAFIQVRLCDGGNAMSAPDIDEMGGFHAVAGGKRQGFKNSTTCGVLAGERLVESGEVRAEAIEERSHEDLRDPSAAAGIDSLLGEERALIEAFDIADFRIADERAESAGDETGMDVCDVAIDISDQIAAALMDGFPEVFALAGARFQMGQNPVGGDDGGPGIGGELAGAVRGAGVDDDEFIDQGAIIDERDAEGIDDAGDGAFLIQCGNAE